MRIIDVLVVEKDAPNILRHALQWRLLSQTCRLRGMRVTIQFVLTIFGWRDSPKPAERAREVLRAPVARHYSDSRDRAVCCSGEGRMPYHHAGVPLAHQDARVWELRQYCLRNTI